MSVEKAIENFGSRFLAAREPTENPRVHELSSGSHSSDCSQAFEQAWLIEQMMMQGIVPPHYTKCAICQDCGPIWIFESSGTYVLGCPWCHVLAKGVKILRPNFGGDYEE